MVPSGRLHETSGSGRPEATQSTRKLSPLATLLWLCPSVLYLWWPHENLYLEQLHVLTIWSLIHAQIIASIFLSQSQNSQSAIGESSDVSLWTENKKREIVYIFL